MASYRLLGLGSPLLPPSMRSPPGERGSLGRHRKNHAPTRTLEGLGPETSTAPAPHINTPGPETSTAPAPHITRQGHARATPGPRQGRARGVQSVRGSPLLEPTPAPEHAFPSGRTRIPSKASKKPCSRSGSGGVGAGNEHRTSAPHIASGPRQGRARAAPEASKA